MTRWYSTTSALDMSFPNSSFSVHTTMFLRLYDSATLSQILSHLMTCQQIKGKNDQSVLKYGKFNVYYYSQISSLTVFLQLNHHHLWYATSTRTRLLTSSFLVPGTWQAHHNHSTRLRSLRNIQTRPSFYLLFVPHPNKPSSSAQPTWVSQ